MTNRTRSVRVELRATVDERSIIDRAAEISGVDRTAFVLGHSIDAANRILADRDQFELDPAAIDEWERINERPARDLAGLRELFARRSPFIS